MSGRVLIAIYGKVDASLSLCMEMNASVNGHVSIVINGNLGTLSIYKNESGRVFITVYGNKDVSLNRLYMQAVMSGSVLIAIYGNIVGPWSPYMGIGAYQ